MQTNATSNTTTTSTEPPPQPPTSTVSASTTTHAPSNNNNKRPADIDSTTLHLLKEYEQINIHQFTDGYIEENLALYDFQYEAENGIDSSNSSSDSDSGIDANKQEKRLIASGKTKKDL